MFYELCMKYAILIKEKEREKKYNDHYFSEYRYLFILSNTVLSKVDYVQ